MLAEGPAGEHPVDLRRHVLTGPQPREPHTRRSRAAASLTSSAPDGDERHHQSIAFLAHVQDLHPIEPALALDEQAVSA